MNTPNLERAVEGFLLAKSAEGRSPNTLSDYRVNLTRFAKWSDDSYIQEITSRRINEFFHWLRHDYRITKRGNHPIEGRKLSPKSIKNCWAAMSSFWKWCTLEFEIDNPFRIPMPKATTKPIVPLEADEVKRLVKAVENKRDKALLLTFLDTGARVSEICSANIGDVELDTGRLYLRNTKGDKPRLVLLGMNSRKAAWSYLCLRDEYPDDPLFMDYTNTRRITRNSVRLAFYRIADRAGVENVHPHRLRHTFAVTYLRNQGDVFSLQELLGHSDLEMVKRYVRLANADLERAHRRASPCDNWGLR